MVSITRDSIMNIHSPVSLLSRVWGTNLWLASVHSHVWNSLTRENRRFLDHSHVCAGETGKESQYKCIVLTLIFDTPLIKCFFRFSFQQLPQFGDPRLHLTTYTDFDQKSQVISYLSKLPIQKIDWGSTYVRYYLVFFFSGARFLCILVVFGVAQVPFSSIYSIFIRDCQTSQYQPVIMRFLAWLWFGAPESHFNSSW